MAAAEWSETVVVRSQVYLTVHKTEIAQKATHFLPQNLSGKPVLQQYGMKQLTVE